MRKYTQREIKNLVRLGTATDITSYNFDTMKEFLNSHNLEKVGCSSGVYGINAGVLQDIDTKKLYCITARNSALMMAF